MSTPIPIRIVLTGGPGAGKTTLLAELARRGHAVAPEAGRSIIRQQVAIGGVALPWVDRAKYAEAMLNWDMRSFDDARPGITYFDRGIPDTIGYLRLVGLPVPGYLHRAAGKLRYSSPVFALPFWRDIYVQDGERQQDSVEAEATARIMLETYEVLGYDLVEVPTGPVEARADFVIDQLVAGGHFSLRSPDG